MEIGCDTIEAVPKDDPHDIASREADVDEAHGVDVDTDKLAGDARTCRPCASTHVTVERDVVCVGICLQDGGRRSADEVAVGIDVGKRATASDLPCPPAGALDRRRLLRPLLLETPYQIGDVRKLLLEIPLVFLEPGKHHFSVEAAPA